MAACDYEDTEAQKRGRIGHPVKIKVPDIILLFYNVYTKMCASSVYTIDHHLAELQAEYSGNFLTHSIECLDFCATLYISPVI